MSGRSLHQQLPVVLASSSANFVRLPRSFAASVRAAFPAKAHGVVALRIGWLGPPNPTSGGLARPCEAFVGWTDAISEGYFIQVPTALAESLGLSEAVQAARNVSVVNGSEAAPLVLSVAVVPYAPIAARVDVDPVTADDWDILQLHANLVEEELLGQICVLGPEQKFPMWVHGHTRINMQVSAINLVERGQAMCVRLARNTEVVVAPKLRAKQDVERQIHARRNEIESARLAQPYVLRTQALDLEDRDLIASEEDCNGTGFVHPSVIARLSNSSGGKWPALVAKDDGIVTFKGETSRALAIFVANPRRAKLLARARKSGQAPKRALVSAANQACVRLRVSSRVSPGHIVLPPSVMAVCKLRALEQAVLTLPRFEPMQCPDAFPALQVRLALLLGSEEAAALERDNDHLISMECVRESTSAVQQWQRRACGVQGVPLSNGAVLALGGRYFVTRIVDEDATEKDKDRQKALSCELVPWLVTRGSKIEWQVEKYAVDVALQKLDSAVHEPGAGPEEGTVSLNGLGSNGYSSALASNRVNIKSLLVRGMRSYNCEHFDGPSLSGLASVRSQADTILARLRPLLDGAVARKRLAVGAPHPGGVYLCGGRGLGKSTLASAVARELRCSPRSLVHTVWIACAHLRGGKRSEVESVVKRAFAEAMARAPSLIVLDDLDLLLPSPAGGESGGGGGEDSQLTWLAEWLEDLIFEYQRKLEVFESNETEVRRSADQFVTHRAVSWLATGREKGSLRKSLLRPGLFDKVSELQPLTAHDRTVVLNAIVKERLSEAFGGQAQPKALHLDEVAGKAEGYAPADLDILVERAMHCAILRRVDCAASLDGDPKGQADTEANALVPTDNDNQFVTIQDFEDALDGFTPSALRGVALAKSDVEWSDVGGLSQVRRVLKETLELPIRFAPLYERCPQRLASGVLLYGPPGCGKTLLAGAVAKECGLNFISVKGPEVLNKYIGASEQAVRDLFARGAAAAPCIVFFDEFDAVAPRRGNDSSGVTDRVVNQLLTFLDGVEARSGVYVMAASSRPDLVDPALLRPGRLDKQLLCGFPDAEERTDILRTIARKMDFTQEALDTLGDVANAPEAELFTGADLQAILYSAQLDSVHSTINPADMLLEDSKSSSDGKMSNDLVISENKAPVDTQVRPIHVRKALTEARPSVSLEERQRYNKIYDAFKGDRGADFQAVSGYEDGKQRTALK